MKNDVYEGDKATPGGNCPLKLGQNKGQIRAQPVEQDGQRKQKTKNNSEIDPAYQMFMIFICVKFGGKSTPRPP